jgi:NAD-dependent dihydropyrimidine dehydrogenase PreA subunit
MPGLFIDVVVDPTAAGDPALAKRLEDACPVDIFEATDSGVRVVETNLDECTLCDLCLEAAPEGAVRVIRLYEKEQP